MLKKVIKNILFGEILLICFFSFFYFNFCLAEGPSLEIDYPALPTGEALSNEPELPTFLLYLYNFGIWFGFLATVLSLIVAGGLYLLSNAIPKMKVSAKDRFRGALTGFLLLLFTYLIATTINPALGIFEVREKLKEPPEPPAEEEPAGVYFYNKANCSVLEDEENPSPAIGSIADLGDLKNRVNSVKIIQKWGGTKNDSVAYIALLYDVIDFWGKCQYVNPNKECNNVAPFAASSSIYQYGFNPIGKGVTFYRKSFYDESGGSYAVKNNQIKGVYVADLNKLQFENVPAEEQNCAKWDIKNNCIERKSPTLANQNISSIKIDGNYIVLLAYFNPATDNPINGPWTFCQIFPTTDDINKEGPKQIKWEAIQNQQWLPNRVVILPVARK